MKSTAILMAFILTISVFSSVAAVSTIAAASTVTATSTEAATPTPSVAAPPTVVATAIPTVAAAKTTTTITASEMNPVVNHPVTFTVTLKSSTTPLNDKPVKIWHTSPGGVRWEDGTHNTNANGVYTFTQAFGSTGQRIYHAEFVGDSQYAASSGTVTVNVGTTTTTITASKMNPNVGSAVILTVTVKAGTTVLTEKQVKVSHTTPDGKTWPDGPNNGVFNTGSSGVITFSSGTYKTAGERVYTAAFVGDSQYAKSTGPATVYVGAPTALNIEAMTQTLTSNQVNIIYVGLLSGYSHVSGKTVVLHAIGSTTDLGSVTTNAISDVTKVVKLPAGEYWIYATFAGEGNYAACRSNLVYIKVAGTAPVKKPTTLHVYSPGQMTPVNTKFELKGSLTTGVSPIGNKPLKIIYLYKSPSGSWSAVKTLATINSENDGYYSYSWQAPAKGEYVFRVGYDGDSGYYASASNDLVVIVS